MSSSFSHQSAEGARALLEHSHQTWSAPQSVTEAYADSTSQQLNEQVLLLQSKQRHLKSRLNTLLHQQLQENFGHYGISRTALSMPTSLEMMIFGLREELERVSELLLFLQQKSAPSS